MPKLKRIPAQAKIAWAYGVDPGTTGGIALLNSEGELVTWRFDKLRGMSDLFAIYEQGPEAACRFYLEKVGAMPHMGRSSCFKFGRNYGIHYMCAIAAGLIVDEVSAVAWQRAVKITKVKGGTDKHAQRKKRNLERALELFPGAELNAQTCDAALIARYGLIQQGYPI